MKKILANYSGFMLVEVLIALLIVSIAFSAILFSVSQNVRTALRLEERVAAAWVAEDVITRAQLGLLKGSNGIQNSLNKDWGWQIHAKATQSAYVQEIEVTIQDLKQNTVLMSTGYVGMNRAQ
jgi:general secretion pathway protein I